MGSDPGVPLEEVCPIPGMAKDGCVAPSDAPGAWDGDCGGVGSWGGDEGVGVNLYVFTAIRLFERGHNR